MNRTRPAVAVAIPVLLLPLLSGCFANPLETLTREGGEQAVEEIIEGQGGEGVDIDLGDSATLPASWPGLPTPDGRLFSAIATDATIVLAYEIDDASKGTALVDELLSMGFTQTANADYGELVTYVLESPEWMASVGWVIADDGVSLNYSISPRS